MTNTRITDPEVLERRYPVVLREFSIRTGSGGGGQFRGGDGVVREMEFLEPVRCGILSERRTTAPHGLHGASDGQPGRNTLIRNGKSQLLDGHASFDVEAGAIVRIETPGGGGYNSKR
jgi:5-oxoprolinase (ATP-hydrolysing)